MNDAQNQNRDPWEPQTYRTGATRPRKSHGGLIAVLLILVILLGGIVTILSVVNIRLFRQMNNPHTETLPIVASNQGEQAGLQNDTASARTDETDNDSIDLQESPISQDTPSEQGGLSLQAIYEKAVPSVVSISCTLQGGSSTGTGVILSEKGYIVTNCHVVEGAKTIQVLLTDERTFTASLVGTDAISDLAVLQIPADDLVPAALGDSGVLRVGDSVVAIGDPLGLELRGTMTNGIVSAINRDINMEGRTMNLIQTNAALNSGNSGGPLLNCYGQVIGINTMKMGDSMSIAGVEGLGFAIPSTTVRDVVNQLIGQGYVSGRPTLGITGESVSSFYQFYYRLPEGLYITEVASGSSAETVGIQPGDILISLDGIRIPDSETLKTQVYTYQPGDAVKAVIYRSGRQYSTTLTVGEATN